MISHSPPLEHRGASALATLQRRRKETFAPSPQLSLEALCQKRAPDTFTGCETPEPVPLRPCSGDGQHLLCTSEAWMQSFCSTPRLSEPTGGLCAEPGNLLPPWGLKTSHPQGAKPPPGHFWISRPATTPVSAPLFSLVLFPSVNLIVGMQNDVGAQLPCVCMPRLRAVRPSTTKHTTWLCRQCSCINRLLST